MHCHCYDQLKLSAKSYLSYTLRNPKHADIPADIPVHFRGSPTWLQFGFVPIPEATLLAGLPKGQGRGLSVFTETSSSNQRVGLDKKKRKTYLQDMFFCGKTDAERYQAPLSVTATVGHLSREMNPTIGIAVILTVLQAANCQMIKDLSACLLGQSLRVDCRYENKTSNPLTYEFSITKDNRKHVIHSTISVSENIYRSRANVTMHKNLVCLYLQSFTTSDEGVYMCELKATNDYTGNQIKNITVIKDKLEKCAGFSLLIQNTSWLLLLLLSLPLLQAVDFVSL
ncbi:Thy1 [Columba livia]|nr:Thy1 [Columba livia]